MLTNADLKALAAWLRNGAEQKTTSAKDASKEKWPRFAAGLESEAEELNHWAAGIEELAQARALTALDLPPPAPAIEGLTDGPCFCFGGTCTACREREDGRPAATFFPRF